MVLLKRIYKCLIDFDKAINSDLTIISTKGILKETEKTDIL